MNEIVSKEGSKQVSKSVSQSVENPLNMKFLNFHNYLIEGLRIDLKSFLGLAMSIQCSQTVRKSIYV